MTRPLAIPEPLRERQARASNPKASAWVSANAGSGKTHVLAQRVLRLLLDGAAPAKILCLTFTKAAAANMADRIFNQLAEWTSLSDDALAKAIIGLRRAGASSAGTRLRATIVRAHDRDARRSQDFKRCTPFPRGCSGSFRSKPTSRPISR